MSLELIREAVKVNQVIGEDSVQTVFENDIIVPDVKPDIARILILDGDIFVKDTETVQDKILINGNICFKILYVSDETDKCIKSISANTDFSYNLDVIGLKHGMKSKVKCDIEHIDFSLLNSRKISIKTIVKLNGRAYDEVEQGVVNNIAGMDEIQVLKDKVNVNCFIGINEASHSIKETMEVPAGKPTIKEVLRNDIKITGKDYKITDNKVIAKGEVNVSTLYIADDETRSIQFMEHEIPFTQFIDLDGLSDSSMCEVDYRVAGYQFEAAEDSDGELRLIHGEVDICVTVDGYEKRSLEIIEDAYSPKARLNIEKEPFSMKELVTENKGQIVLKDTITIQDDSPEIAEVFNVICKPGLSESKIADNKVTVEGIVNNNVLYLANSEEQPVYCYQQEVPFKHTLDIKGIIPDMTCDIDLDIDHCNYSMISATEVEIRLVINVSAKVINNVMIPLVVKANELPIDEKKFISQPSITIYFSQPGDNLWKIAKKYYTTVDDILKVNSIADRDFISPGQKVIIPRRIS